MRMPDKVHGRAFLAFINNFQCHLTTIEAYSDGAINCWGFCDIPLFQEKLRQRWVVPGPKNGQSISVFNFGLVRTVDGRWRQSASSIDKQVRSAIQNLNPSLSGLIDMQGSDTELRGKARYAKMGMKKSVPIKANDDGTDVRGDMVPTLRRTASGFELTKLFVFSDGSCRIGSDHHSLSLNEVESRFQSGELANVAGPRSKISLPGLGEFSTGDRDFGGVVDRHRVAELHDKFRMLNGDPGAVELCRRAWDEFERNSSGENRSALKWAYENVPAHLRIFCGDMDSKDWPIRRAIYPDTWQDRSD